MKPIRLLDNLTLLFAATLVTLVILDLVGTITLPSWVSVTVYIGMFVCVGIVLLSAKQTANAPCTSKSDHRFQYAHTHDDDAYTFTCDRCGKRIIMRTADNASAAGFTDDTVDDTMSNTN